MDLAALTQGQQGIITGFNGMAASCQRQLYDMGIYIGSEVFSQYQGLILMGLHVLSLVVALLSAKLLSLTVFNKRSPQFVLEVPPYRRPLFKDILIQTFNRGTDFFQTLENLLF